MHFNAVALFSLSLYAAQAAALPRPDVTITTASDARTPAEIAAKNAEIDGRIAEDVETRDACVAAAVTPRDEARCIDSFNFEVGNLERIRAASFEDGSTIQQEAQAKSDNFFARVVDPATLRTLPAWTAQFDKLRAAADARLEPCYAAAEELEDQTECKEDFNDEAEDIAADRAAGLPLDSELEQAASAEAETFRAAVVQADELPLFESYMAGFDEQIIAAAATRDACVEAAANAEVEEDCQNDFYDEAVDIEREKASGLPFGSVSREVAQSQEDAYRDLSWQITFGEPFGELNELAPGSLQ